MMATLLDPFGRRIDYLRISVTDRCNLRCAYCMPLEGIDWIPRSELLTLDQILQVVRAAAEMGISRIRLTGGEPLVRPDVIDLVHAIAHTPDIQEVSLTTNGLLLEKRALALAQAGLKRVNVSLDTLDPQKFHHITRFGELPRLWHGLAAAEQAGLDPIKINTVVVRGINDDELVELAKLTLSHPWHVRFIELMPVGNGGDWGESFPPTDNRYFPVQEMLKRLAPLDLKPVERPVGNGPARTFQIPGAMGIVGFISPVGEHFCQSCNRLRLTADGRLRPCLLQDDEVDVHRALQDQASLCALIEQVVARKPEGHSLLGPFISMPKKRVMCQIGG